MIAKNSLLRRRTNLRTGRRFVLRQRRNFQEKFFPANKAPRIFEYLDGYSLQSLLSLTLFDDAFDDIKRDTMSEEPRRARAGFRRKTSAQHIAGEPFTTGKCSQMQKLPNFPMFLLLFSKEILKTNELDTFKDIKSS